MAGFYRYAEQDGLLDRSPAVHVRRPRLDYESHATGLDRNEVGALLVAAGLGRPAEHALVSLLAINGLRVSEALGADIDALGLERGHRTLTVCRKGGKVVTIPLAPRTARAIDLAIGEQLDRPIFLDSRGERLDRHAAARIVRRLARRAGINKPVGPHTSGTPSSPPPWTPGCPSATSKRPPATPTPAPPCATTEHASPSTATPPTSSPPSSLEPPGSQRLDTNTMTGPRGSGASEAEPAPHRTVVLHADADLAWARILATGVFHRQRRLVPSPDAPPAGASGTGSEPRQRTPSPVLNETRAVARFSNRFSSGAPPLATSEIEREIVSLMEPAAQRAAIDLYVLTHGRPGEPMQRREFYEVTFVQFLYQYLLMVPSLAHFQILWEVPYQPAQTQGHPFQVDIELRRPDNPIWQRMLIEVGLFSTKKLKDDSEKLRDLTHQGQPVLGEKRVLLYWLTDAPGTAAETRKLVRERQARKQNVARVGTNRVRPLWVRGFELFTPTATAGSQFTAVMFEVLP